MKKLAVNVDHVATLREARRTTYPDPVEAAILAELAGAEGIVVHLREDRRHIKERDLRLLREVVKTSLNLEMAAVEEMVKIACEVKPDMATLVPERREELTTEGGLDVIGHVEQLREVIPRLKEAGIVVSLFVDPDMEQVKAAKEVGADAVEIHTGLYSEAKGQEERERELNRIEMAAKQGKALYLSVRAGHGLNYWNVRPIAAIPEIEELSIGHAIVARAVLVGMERAVREMIELLR
ncbi:MAG: pyridoxine 5'-phosphate synthase [Deltaproteobacteria bacterium]|nr:MAG: pyridoxine 5'-phosphate synthase [Deltaproteobacteria bacterium]